MIPFYAKTLKHTWLQPHKSFLFPLPLLKKIKALGFYNQLLERIKVHTHGRRGDSIPCDMTILLKTSYIAGRFCWKKHQMKGGICLCSRPEHTLIHGSGETLVNQFLILGAEWADDQIQGRLLNEPGRKVGHDSVTEIRGMHIVPGLKTCTVRQHRY